MPKFSIIIPAYNSERYIINSIGSVVTQKFRDFELIVPCDSCEDNTEEIAQAYDAKTVSGNWHMDGLCRNAGLDIATGDWVLFLDDDDWWMHEYVLTELDKATKDTEADIVLFDFVWRGLGYIHQTPQNNYVSVWNKCWRRDFIGNTRFQATPHWSDGMFHRELMRKHPKAGFLGECMYYYNYLREGSISWQAEHGMIPKATDVKPVVL